MNSDMTKQQIQQDKTQTKEPVTFDLDLDLIPPPITTDPPTSDEEPTPECSTGFTLDNNGQCERTVTQTPECPAEFTFNPAIDQCEQRQTQATT